MKRTAGTGWERHFWIAAIAGLLVLVGMPAEAPAQSGDRPPVVVSLVHAGPGSQGRSYRELRSILKGSEAIEFRKPGGTIRALSTRGVQRKTLRDPGKRTSRREEIGDAMRDVGLELMFIYWEANGQKHFVAMGPTGRELRHFRPDAKEALSTEGAKKLLRKVFEVAMPEVYDFRDDPQKQRQEAEQTETAEASAQSEGSGGGGEPTTPEELRRQAIKKHRSQHGNMFAHVRADLHPIGGTRNLTVSAPEQFKHNAPILGGRLDILSIVSMVSSDTVGLALTGTVDFSAFKTKFAFDDGSSKTVPGTYFQGQTTFRYMKGVSSPLVIFGEAGVNYTNVGLQSNQQYVGSQYLSAVAGFGTLIRPSSQIDIEIAGRVLPILSGDTNDKKYGSPTPGIGANGRLKISYRRFNPWRITAFYDLSYMSVNYSDPPDIEKDSVGASDLFHVAGIGVGYRLGFGE